MSEKPESRRCSDKNEHPEHGYSQPYYVAPGEFAEKIYDCPGFYGYDINGAHHTKESARLAEEEGAWIGWQPSAQPDAEWVNRQILVELRELRRGQHHLIGFLTGLASALSSNPLLGLRKFRSRVND